MATILNFTSSCLLRAKVRGPDDGTNVVHIHKRTRVERKRRYVPRISDYEIDGAENRAERMMLEFFEAKIRLAHLRAMQMAQEIDATDEDIRSTTYRQSGNEIRNIGTRFRERFEELYKLELRR